MGFGAQLIFWPEALCEGLAAKRFRVVRFDNRDVGKSTHLAGQPAPDPRALFAEVMSGRRPHVPYSLDDMANDVVGLMDALGVSHAHIVGASMGAMIANWSMTTIRTGRRASSRSCPPRDAGICRRGIRKRCPCCSARRTARAARISSKRAFSCKRRWPARAFRQAKRAARARAAFRTDYAPFDMDGVARQSAALIVAEPRNERLKKLRCPALVLDGAGRSGDPR